MVNPYRFYTYAYLRENGTPYYIGKGQRKRIYESKGKPCRKPKDKSRIIFLKTNLTEQEAFKHEVYMIALFGRKDLGTGILHNKTDGGEGSSGFQHSEETKIYMSKNKKGKASTFLGKSHSEDTRKKMSELKIGKYNGSGNPMFGKSHSQEVRDNISKANSGRKRTEEEKKKMSENSKRKNNNFYGKYHSQETKKKLSELNKGKMCPEEIKKKISSAHNKLLRFRSPSGEIIEEITTLRKFCEKYNLSRDGMSKLIKGEQQQSKGWSMPPKELAHGFDIGTIFGL